MTRFKKLFLFLCFLILLIIEFVHPIDTLNEDLGRHLTLGKIIFQTHHLPTTNLFSYTNPDFHFINSHWLSEVIFYLITRSIGLNGLLFLTTTIVLVICSFLFWKQIKHVSLLGLFFTSLLIAGILFERAVVRPEIFSFAFFSVFLLILYHNYQKPTKWLFVLPIVELLWANMHIYFILGPLLIFLFFLDAFIHDLKNKHQPLGHVLRDKKYSILFSVFLLTCFALLINPYDLKGALYPFFVFQNYGFTIAENLPTFSKQWIDPAVTIFEITSLVSFWLLFAYRKQSRLIDWMLVIFFIIFGLAAVRNFVLFAFISLLILPRYMSEAILSFKRFQLIQNHSKLTKNLALILLLFFAFWEIGTFTSYRSFGAGTTIYAQNAVDFFIQHNLKGPIFNNFDIGGYLIYRLYPTEKVFVDNRPEAYPASFLQNIYLPALNQPDVFNKLDEKYHFNTIIFQITYQSNTSFVINMLKDNNWKLVYLDTNVVILAKNSPSNQKLIKNYFVQENTFNPNSLQTHDVSTLNQFSYFLDAIGWHKAEIHVLQNALNDKPHSCLILYELVNLYLHANDEKHATFYGNQFRSYCQLDSVTL